MVECGRYRNRNLKGRVCQAVEKRDVVMTGEGCRDEMAAEKSCPAKNQEFHPLSPDYEE